MDRLFVGLRRRGCFCFVRNYRMACVIEQPDGYGSVPGDAGLHLGHANGHVHVPDRGYNRGDYPFAQMAQLSAHFPSEFDERLHAESGSAEFRVFPCFTDKRCTCDIPVSPGCIFGHEFLQE